MNEGPRLLLAAFVAALVTGLVMGLDEMMTGHDVFWGLALLIGIVVALVLVYGVALLIFWGQE